MDITIDTLVAKSGTPVSLPEVFVQINELTQDPRSSVADIARVAETDAGLSARILKIVNSPYYGFPSSIDNITRAVSILGMQDLRDLALATTTIDLFANNKHQHKHIIQLWRHNLFCAVIAKSLAEQLSQLHVERFFVAGLLHDIGRLIMFQGLPEETHQAIDIARTSGENMLHIEQSMLGFTHTDVGARIVSQWKLPSNIIEVVAFHHTPAKAKQFPLETSVIHLANNLASIIDPDSNLAGTILPLDTHAIDVLGLDNSVLQTIHDDVMEQFAEMYALLFPDVKAA